MFRLLCSFTLLALAVAGGEYGSNSYGKKRGIRFGSTLGGSLLGRGGFGRVGLGIGGSYYDDDNDGYGYGYGGSVVGPSYGSYYGSGSGYDDDNFGLYNNYGSLLSGYGRRYGGYLGSSGSGYNIGGPYGAYLGSNLGGSRLLGNLRFNPGSSLGYGPSRLSSGYGPVIRRRRTKTY